MSRLFAAVFFLCSPAEMCAQHLSFTPDSTSVVWIEVRSTGSKGSGFVISVAGDTVYLLTARHVIAGYDGAVAGDISITVGSSTLAGRVCFDTDSSFNDAYDVALLYALAKDSNCKAWSVLANPEYADGFYFFKAQDKKRWPPYGAEPGNFDFWTNEGNCYQIFMNGVESGDSGSALLSGNSIAGIILKTDRNIIRVLSMSRVLTLLADRLPAACSMFIVDNQ